MDIGFNSMNTPLDPPPHELARALEERGFESLWYGEHSHIPCALRTPYPAGGPLPEPYRHIGDPYVSLMAVAAATTRLRIGTAVALLMERELFSQAKTIATLDRLSGGRVILGCGVGWNAEEFANTTRHPWERRYALMRETVAALRTLWRDEQAEYHGEFIDFDPVWCNPKPLQAGGPPVVFGVLGRTGIRHAAQWADGWMPIDFALRDLAVSIQRFRAAVAEGGRDPDTVEISLIAMRSPDLDTLKRYRDLGIRRVMVGVDVELWDKPEAIRPMIDRYAEMIPHLGR